MFISSSGLASNKFHCTEESDSEDYDDDSENIDDKAHFLRIVNVVDTECLTPENIGIEHDKQPKINMIKSRKSEGKKPEWSEVAQ